MNNVNTDNLENDLRELVAEIVECDSEEVTLEANFVDDLGMDSMMALEILAAVEKKYSLQIPEDYLGRINTLKELVELAEKFITEKQ